MRMKIAQVTFTLALAAVFGFGFATLTSEPAEAQFPACPTLACAGSGPFQHNGGLCYISNGSISLQQCCVQKTRVGRRITRCFHSCLEV